MLEINWFQYSSSVKLAHQFSSKRRYMKSEKNSSKGSIIQGSMLPKLEGIILTSTQTEADKKKPKPKKPKPPDITILSTHINF